MQKRGKAVVILMAEDDADDRLLTQVALQEAHLTNEIRYVEDGEELLDYLLRQGEYVKPASSPRPGLILLDLNLPRKSGRQALAEIKSNPELRAIPIIVLTTSKAEEDILRTYELGVSGYVTKPVSLAALIHIMEVINRYWFEIVELPER